MHEKQTFIFISHYDLGGVWYHSIIHPNLTDRNGSEMSVSSSYNFLLATLLGCGAAEMNKTQFLSLTSLQSPGGDGHD